MSLLRIGSHLILTSTYYILSCNLTKSFTWCKKYYKMHICFAGPKCNTRETEDSQKQFKKHKSSSSYRTKNSKLTCLRPGRWADRTEGQKQETTGECSHGKQTGLPGEHTSNNNMQKSNNELTKTKWWRDTYCIYPGHQEWRVRLMNRDAQATGECDDTNYPGRDRRTWRYYSYLKGKKW